MSELGALVKEGRKSIWAALLIFAFGSLLGYVYQAQLTQVIQPFLQNLEGLVERIAEYDHPLYITWFIFQNNLIAALTMLFAGTVLFIIPIFSLLMNGLAVGYILALTSAEQGTSALAMLVFGILPHGILELPAVFLAGGMGLFYGLRLLQWLFGRGQFLAHLSGGMRTSVGKFWREETLPVLKRRARGTLKLVVFLAVVLLLAAVIESFITPALLYLFVY